MGDVQIALKMLIQLIIEQVFLIHKIVIAK